MDYKKAYEEALERAKRWADGTLQPDRTTPQGVCETIFPELATSEDEKIRREIIGYLNSRVSTAEETELLYFKRWIAWLERQQDSIPYEKYVEDIAAINAGAKTKYHAGWNDGYEAKQKEQKPYEPKNWPVDKDAITQEQKPVEYLSKDRVYAIMKKLTHLSFSPLFSGDSDEYKTINEITNDVRDLLDYPIEPKPAAWSEEDEEILDGLISLYSNTYSGEKWPCKRGGYITYGDVLKFLKSLPERLNLQPMPDKDKLMQDIKPSVLKDIISHLYDEGFTGWCQTLRLLLPRLEFWPSEEQMEVLEIIVRYGDKESTHIKSIRDLYEQLKKLKEE